MKVSVASDSVCHVGESPLWHALTESIYWIDIFAPCIHKLHVPSGELSTVIVPHVIGCIAHRDDTSLYAAMGDGVWIVHLDDMRCEHFKKVIDTSGSLRMNDGKCDPFGRFWFSSMDGSFEHAIGSLYCMDLDGEVEEMETGIHVGNGLDWSPDCQYMYYTDSMRQTIYRYDYDKVNGDISNRQDFYIEHSDAAPDGLAVDKDGNVWSALWNGSCIKVISPDGQSTVQVAMPCERPTSIAFADDGKSVYVTSAKWSADETRPDGALPAGNLFRVELNGHSE